MAIIGAIICDSNGSFDRIDEAGVTSEWFNAPENKNSFEMLSGMRAMGKPIDILTFHSGLPMIGGRTYEEACVDKSVIPSMLEGYISELRKAFHARKLDTGLSMAQSMLADKAPIEDVTGIISRTLDNINQHKIRKDESLYDIGTRIIDGWEHPENRGGIEPRWSGLSRLIGAFPDGSLTYLSGRPSQGKTTAATNQAGYNILRGIPTAMATLEMTRERIVKRMIAEIGEIPSMQLEFGGSKELIAKAKRTVDDFKKMPFYLADWPMDASQLRAWAKYEQRRHGIKMLILDRIELLRAPRGVSEADLFTKTSTNSILLQQLAKELGIPVIALSQLNRQCDIENREPELYDLRQSGSLEQDATIVLMIFRDLRDPTLTWFKVAKSQDTRTGRIPMAFKLDINRLVEDMSRYK